VGILLDSDSNISENARRGTNREDSEEESWQQKNSWLCLISIVILVNKKSISRKGAKAQRIEIQILFKV